jgi:predicted TIM-barrel fold metal-dependent hydrolase
VNQLAPCPGLVDLDCLIGRHPQVDVGDGGVPQLLAMMDRFGIEQAVVTHTQSWLYAPALGNAQVTALVQDQPRLRACWVLLPDTCAETEPAADFVSSALCTGVAAVRAYPRDHGYRLDGADAAPLLHALAAAGLPLIVNADQLNWERIEIIAARHPSLELVVTRTNYRSLREIAGVLGRRSRVRVTLAGLLSHCGLEWIVRQFGPARVVFGTGWPERDPAEAVARLLWSELGDAEVAAIGSANLHRMLAEGVALDGRRAR